MTIYAIDFDGTIVEEKFPEIGALKPEAAEFIRHIRQNGDKWILFTLREDKYLEDAVAFLLVNDLIPDAINDNLPEKIRQWGNNPRKISADIYIDDRNANGLSWPWDSIQNSHPAPCHPRSHPSYPLYPSHPCSRSSSNPPEVRP